MLICIWFLLYNILSHSYIQLITGCNCGGESLSQPRKSTQSLIDNTMTFSSPPPTKRAKVSENGNQNGNANTNVGDDQLQSFMSPPQCFPSLNDKESKKIESLENICFEPIRLELLKSLVDKTHKLKEKTRKAMRFK